MSAEPAGLSQSPLVSESRGAAGLCRLRAVEGVPVVLASNGSLQGRVDRAYLDSRDGRLIGITVRRGGGFLSRGDLYRVRADAIHGIGPGAVTLSGPDALDRSDYADQELARAAGEDPLGKMVVTLSGQRIGIVRDVLFDPATRTVSAYEVSGGWLQSPAHGTGCIDLATVVSVGHDVVVVLDAVEAARRAGPFVEHGWAEHQGLRQALHDDAGTGADTSWLFICLIVASPEHSSCASGYSATVGLWNATAVEA